MIRGASLIACAGLATLCVQVAHAEPTVAGAEPAERGSEWYVADSLDFRGTLRPAVGIVGDYAYGALRARDVAGKDSVELVTDRVVARVGGTLVLADRFRVGALLPVALFDNLGDPAPGVFTESKAPALGDLRLSASARLLGRHDRHGTLAIGVRAYLPTGSEHHAMSAGRVHVDPQLLFAGKTGAFVYAAGIGLAFLPRERFAGTVLASQLTFNAAFGVKVNDRVVMGPELFGSTQIDGPDSWLAPRTTPVEILLGGHLRLGDDFTIGTSIGTRLTRADTAPTMRVLAVFDYAPDFCVDKDDDHICATKDACPEAEGPRTDDPKTNGCPTDSDGDGVLDREDVCPHAPGVKNGPPERRGCPILAPP